MTERGSLAELQSRYGTRHRWLMLATVMIGSMAAIMSSTIMNVGIPDMSLQFGIGQELAQWVSSSFMVAMTVSMLTTPWLLARFGYRTTYVGCMLVLLTAGIAGGLSTDYNWVLAARVTEGLAAGVVQPIPAIIILRAFLWYGRSAGSCTGSQHWWLVGGLAQLACVVFHGGAVLHDVHRHGAALCPHFRPGWRER
jgi:MFS family permease